MVQDAGTVDRVTWTASYFRPSQVKQNVAYKQVCMLGSIVCAMYTHVNVLYVWTYVGVSHKLYVWV